MPTTGTIPLQSVIPGQLITSALWNTELSNVGTLLDAIGAGGYSVTDNQMQIQTNPFPGGVTSHAGSVSGELERIRYQLAQILGTTYWYQTAPSANSLATVFLSGEVRAFAGTSVPSGFLTCDGSAVSRTTYAALFTAIGTTWGVGDGGSTFNLPDLRGKALYGKDAGSLFTNVGSSGGTQSHTHTGPSHSHTVNSHTHSISSDGAHTHTLTDGGALGSVNLTSGFLHTGVRDDGSHDLRTPNASGGETLRIRNDQTDSQGSHTHTGATGAATPGTDSQGTGATGTANPPYATVLFIIKT